MEYISPNGDWLVLINENVAQNNQGVVKTISIYKKRDDGGRGYILVEMIPLKPRNAD
jgi:hypothetical protein